jgi:hypothetical protein
MLFWLVAMLSWACLAPSVLLAVPPTTESWTLPFPPVPGAPPQKTNGLTVTVDATAAVGVGYCPVKVTVNARTSSLVNRPFTARVGARVYSHMAPPIEASRDFELPAGATLVSVVLQVPQLIVSDSLNFEFEEQGEQLRDLSGSLRSSTRRGYAPYYGPQESMRSILLVASGQLPPMAGSQWDRTLLVLRTPGASTYTPYDLSESAIEYSQWDAVLVSLDELAHIVEHREEAWRAMRRWLLAGGNLCVYGVNDNFRRLTELNKLIDPPVGALPAVARGVQVDDDGWISPRADTGESAINKATTPATGYSPFSAQPQKPEDPGELKKQRPALKKRLTKKPPFVYRTLGMGRVAALDTTAPHDEHQAYWDYLYAELAGVDSADLRRGVSFTEPNPSFWNFLVPGVGAAPIGAFQVLITLFVVGIGPVNYYLLRRRHKLSLLMFTVPAAAAVVTLSLLAYALIADGVSVRARTRSYTEIDQRRGEAACWSRIALYAGMQSSQPLEFPLDTEVYPIEATPDFADYMGSRTRQIDEGHTRHFTSGWLPARTVTQFLTIRARATSAGLWVVPGEDKSPPRVTNRLGTRIEQLYLIGEDGECSFAEHVADGATINPTSIESASAEIKLNEILHRHRLEFPPAWRDNSSGVFGFNRRGRYYWGSTGVTVGSPGSLLEEGIQKAAKVRSLPPRSYVAVVQQSPEFELGLRSANVEASFHLILGHW